MFVNDLKMYTNAPIKGTYLIFTRKEVKYGKYDSQLFLDEYKDVEILEIHLFDDIKEYRAISSRTKGPLETIVDNSNEIDTLTEEVLLENGASVNLVSYIKYDDKGMAIIDNYRLQEVK